MSHEDEIEREERSIYVIVGLACLPVVIAAFIHGGALDGGTSLSLLVVVAAAAGLLGVVVHRVRRRHEQRVPLARLHDRTRSSRWHVLAALTLGPREAAADEAEPNVTVGGYVETYYQLNVRTPSNRITNLRGFDNRDRTFTIENAAIDVKGERGALTARVILQIGATPSTYYLAEPALPGTGGANATGPELWKYLQQAVFGWATADKLVVEAGLFPSPIGPEVLPIKDNWNWSRSDLFFGLPFYHTGARASVPLGGGWVGTLHAYTGWNSVVDNNRYPSVAVSALYTGAKVTGQVLYFGGIERPTGAPEGKAWRNLFDAYATLEVTEMLSVLGHVDAGFEPNELGTSGWLAGALSAKYAVTPAVYVAVRGDYFRERVASDGTAAAEALFWPSTWMASGTVTLACQPVTGISVRLEYRHDHAQDDSFFGGDVQGDGVTTPFVPNRDAQDTFTLGAVASF